MFLDVASSLVEEYDCTVLSAAQFETRLFINGIEHIKFKRGSAGAISLRDAWLMAKYIYRNRTEFTKFNTFYVRSYPAMIFFAIIGKHFSIPTIFDTRGLFFHELFDSGKIKQPKLLPTLVRIEKWLLQSAKAIICVSESQMQYYLSLEPNPEKYHIIYNAAPNPITSPTREVSSELTIAYVGSMGIWHLPEKINLIVDHLRKYFPNLKFHCITPDTAKAESILSHHPNTFIYSHSFRHQPKQFDLAFCLIKGSFSKKVCFPVKLCEYLAAKTPVIFSDNVDVCNKLNAKYHFGIPVSQEMPPEEIAKEIVRLLPTIRSKDVSLPEELSFERLIHNVVNVIRSI